MKKELILFLCKHLSYVLYSLIIHYPISGQHCVIPKGFNLHYSVGQIYIYICRLSERSVCQLCAKTNSKLYQQELSIEHRAHCQGVPPASEDSKAFTFSVTLHRSSAGLRLARPWAALIDGILQPQQALSLEPRSDCHLPLISPAKHPRRTRAHPQMLCFKRIEGGEGAGPRRE